MRALIRFMVPASVVIVLVALGVAHATLIGHYRFAGGERFAWYTVYAVFLIIAGEALGIPRIRGRMNALWSSLAATLLAAAGMSLVQLLVATPVLPRFVVFASALCLIPVWTMLCIASESIRQRDAGRDRVVVVVDETGEIDRLEREIDRAPERNASLVACTTVGELTGDGGAEHLLGLVRDNRANVVVLDRIAIQDHSIISQAGALHAARVRVRTLALFYDEWLGKLPVGELERITLLFDINELHSVRYARMKRTIDVLAALAGTLVLVLVVPFVWVANLVFNRGPLLYRQPRVGKGGHEFTILKLRTMPPRSDGVTTWTADNDPRVGGFGRLLRRSHLDELPQVLNVLRGELSVVGPRPEQPQYVEQLTASIPFYDVRQLVRPGLTGWAQVKYSYGASELDALEKLQYDVYYLRHQSIALDLRIIGRTLNVVLRQMGR